MTAVLPVAAVAGKLDMKPPEILFIGDSHLSFGAGKVFREFFRDFEKQCSPYERWNGQARAVAAAMANHAKLIDGDRTAFSSGTGSG